MMSNQHANLSNMCNEIKTKLVLYKHENFVTSNSPTRLKKEEMDDRKLQDA